MGRVVAVLRPSNPFADFVNAFAPYASQAIDKKNEEEAWNKFAQTFVPQQPTDTQAVQVAASPIPGQSGIGTQPSSPVQAPQTTTEQVDIPSKDPYKQLEYQTGKEFAAKLGSLSKLAPQERQMAMRQLYQEREQTLANARYDKFSQDMEGIMAEYNPADPVSAYKAKAKAVALGRKLKIDTGDVLKMFDGDKPISVAPGTTLINPRTMQPMYTAPKDNSITPYQQANLNLRRQQLLQSQQNKDNKEANAWEKDHLTYEKTHGVTDAQAMNEYWAMSQDPAQSALITPEKQAKYNVASARINKYLSQPNLTKDEQEFLSTLDRSKLTQEQGFKMLQQYRMNKLNGIRQ